MEFRCRLGTPGGEIIEGIYAADSEARLRQEFEEKGLYVLGIQRAGGAGARPDSRCRRAPASRRASSSSSTRSWRRCSRPGMPLVQSLDILRRASPTRSSSRCWTTSTSGCGRAARCRRRSRRTATLFPGRLHGVAAGGREERQPRAGHPPLRRLRQGGGDGEAEDDLGAGLSGDPAACCRSSSSSIIVLRVVPEFGAFYEQFGEELPLSTRIIVAVSEFARDVLLAADPRRSWRRRRGVLGLAEAARRSASGSTAGCCSCRARADRAEVLDVAGGADAGDAARRRHPAGQRDRRRGAVDQEPLHGARAADGRRSRCAKGGRWRRR